MWPLLLFTCTFHVFFALEDSTSKLGLGWGHCGHEIVNLYLMRLSSLYLFLNDALGRGRHSQRFGRAHYTLQRDPSNTI